MTHHPPCPFCQSKKTRNEDVDHSDDVIYMGYSCECGRTFTRVYEYSETWDENNDWVEVSA